MGLDASTEPSSMMQIVGVVVLEGELMSKMKLQGESLQFEVPYKIQGA